MKNTYQKRNNKGFTIIEMVATMFIIAVILVSIFATVQGIINNNRLTNTITNIRVLRAASMNYYNSNGGSYTNLSITALASNDMLPNNFTSGLNTNSWNGNVTVAPDANPLWFDITLTNVPSAAATSLTNAEYKFSQNSPTYSGGTWEAAFK